MSIDYLIDSIKQKSNPTVVGLDPKIEYVPEAIKKECFKNYGQNLKGASEAIYQFNKELIDALCDIVPAVKPQSAYYEMYGIEGLICLNKTINYARRQGLYVILDVKRNDIGTTAQAYSNAYLGKTDIEGIDISAWDADSITVNPFLGSDGIMPFVADCKKYNKSIFVLVKTSNPSSGELQDLNTGGQAIYNKVANLVNIWGEGTVGKYGYSVVGAVVGATYPEQANKLRKVMENSYFLVPGYGAQGGSAKDVACCFNPDGLGAIINSSRGIMCAYKKGGYSDKDFAKAARAQAIKMRDELLSCIK